MADDVGRRAGDSGTTDGPGRPWHTQTPIELELSVEVGSRSEAGSITGLS